MRSWQLRHTRYMLVKVIEAKLEEQNLNKTLRRYRDKSDRVRASEWCGRVTVLAHEAEGVKGKDKRTNAYLRFRIGGDHYGGSWKRTKTVKNSTTTPDFADEKIDIDITDGNKICENNDATLEVEIFDDNFPFDQKLGRVTIKLKKFIKNPLKPYMAYHQMHVYKFGEGYINTASVKLTISFQLGYEGIAVFTLVDARNLANRELFGKQDPYAVIKVGKNRKRSRTVKDGGTNPSFQSEQLLVHVRRNDFINDVEVKLYDDDVGMDDVIGSCTFSLLPHIQNCAKYRSR